MDENKKEKKNHNLIFLHDPLPLHKEKKNQEATY